jgi:nitroreductase
MISLQQALLQRRTVAHFLPKAVPDSVLRTAIDHARWAQNHKLTEPWRVQILGPVAHAAATELAVEYFLEAKGPDVAERKRLQWSARPGMFAVSYRTTPDDALRNREDYAATCCFVQNLMLALWADGVGGQWGTGDYLRNPRMYDVLGLIAHEQELVGLFSYGYYDPAQLPKSVRRKGVEDILQLLP